MASDPLRHGTPGSAAKASSPTEREALREAWLKENRAAIKSWNAWVETHGLPLAKYRQF